MADNTKIGPIFRGANGGLSDDLFTGIQNSFYYSQNLEIREDMRSIYPCNQAVIANGGGSVTGFATKIIQLTNDKWAVFAGQYVYTLDSDDNSVTGGIDLGGQVCDAEIFGGKIFVTTKTKLLSFDYSSPDWNNPSEIATLTSSDYHPLQATSSTLCIGDKNKIKIVLFNALSTAIDQITLSSNCVVKLLDYLGGYTRIVIEKDFYKNEIGLWDNSKESINERIPMDGYKFLQSCIYKGKHYLVSDKGLGLLNGYDYYIIKRFNKFSDKPNSICVHDDKLYIGGTDGVYIYGAKNKNYPEVLAMWTYIGEKIGALASNSKDIITSTNNKVGANTSAVYNGELHTMGYFGTSLSEIKQSMYLRVGYKVPNGGTLKVYYKTDNVSNRTEISPTGGLKSSSDMRSPFATSLKLNCRFQWIQFKFALTGQDTHLYSADLYYNDMLD